jgi:hypothetical protein
LEVVVRARTFEVANQLSLLAGLVLVGCCGKQVADSAGWEAAATASPAKMVGVLDSADCQSIRGWAWDPKRPDDPLKVDIYDGEQLIATVLADQYRKDLVGAGLGNGKHGFDMAPPSKLSDGAVHPIRAKFSGKIYELNFSPRSFICSEEDAAPPPSPARDHADK